MKSFSIYLSGLAISLTLSSCAISDDGELETTWLFWAILVAVVSFIIYSGISTRREAKEKGITVDQLLKENARKAEKQEMDNGIEIEYLGGYPKWPNPGKVKFRIDNSTIKIVRGSDTLSLAKDDIVAISSEKSGKRSAGRIAAGAVVGGVLTGGIGLIVGGALGARRKDTSELYITYRYNGIELTLNLRTGKNTDKIYSWINSVYA